MGVGGVTEREAATGRPGWLKARRPTETAAAVETLATPAPAVRIKAAPIQSERGGLAGWLESVWFAIRYLHLGWGLGVSLTVHSVVIASLGLIVFNTSRSKEPEFEGIFGMPGDETILDLPPGSDLEVGQPPPPMEFVASSAVVDPAAMLASSSSVMGALNGVPGGTGDGGEGGGGSGSMSNIRVPSSAITKGSFTVWTEPEDPMPRQRYNIVIQVKLPKSVKQYKLRDLTGEVRGTDGYFKQIKYNSTDKKGVKEGVVQLQIAVPGAVQLIKDTIRVKSELLKEEQTIEIVF